ncbi:hypothetical protein LSTR_LSTR006507 [Laodelphax striatellus]|uniref:Uncharacterized protein n=1 Tax=Laodelphax striatellus TaxID=195883 RepID=A0A482WX87_LAOST|nr:hypothetical protein LSTR_LSTR006507 [Laodelphax striatellus]
MLAAEITLRRQRIFCCAAAVYVMPSLSPPPAEASREVLGRQKDRTSGIVAASTTLLFSSLQLLAPLPPPASSRPSSSSLPSASRPPPPSAPPSSSVPPTSRGRADYLQSRPQLYLQDLLGPRAHLYLPLQDPPPPQHHLRARYPRPRVAVQTTYSRDPSYIYKTFQTLELISTFSFKTPPPQHHLRARYPRPRVVRSLILLEVSDCYSSLLRGSRSLVLLAVTDCEVPYTPFQTGVSPSSNYRLLFSLLRGFRSLVLLAVTDCEVPYTPFQTGVSPSSYRLLFSLLRGFRSLVLLAVTDCEVPYTPFQTGVSSSSYRLLSFLPRGYRRRVPHPYSWASSSRLPAVTSQLQIAYPPNYRERLQTYDSRFQTACRHSQLQIAYPTFKNESFSRQKATRRQNRRRHGYSDFSLTSLPRPNYDRV